MAASTLVGFVANPNCGRGTVEILWQCLTTILLCIYTALHLNIPPEPENWRQNLKRTLPWILVGILAPEVVCYRALREWSSARKFKTAWNFNKDQYQSKLSLQQSFFLNSSGIVIRVERRSPEDKVRPVIHLRPVTYDLYYRRLHHNLLSKEAFENLLPSDIEINALSKANLVSKLITSLQATWVVAQIVTRLSMSLDVSLLEVLTSGFVSMALIAYCFWFSKPYNVGRAICVDARMPECPHQRSTTYNELDFLLEWVEWSRITHRLRTLVVPLWLNVLFSGIFGGIHLAAWNYRFPTHAEKQLWRASAIALTATPLVLVLIVTVRSYKLRHRIQEGENIKILKAISLPLVLYLLARLYIIIESFASLRAAPADIYERPTWSSYFGHIGSRASSD